MNLSAVVYSNFLHGKEVSLSFYLTERSSLPSKNFPCISMEMLQIGALVLLGRLVEALGLVTDQILERGSLVSCLVSCVSCL